MLNVQYVTIYLQSQGQRTQTTQSTSIAPTSTTGTTRDQNQNVQTGAQNQLISDEAFTQLVSRIITHMSQAAEGQAPAQTVGDFIRTLGESHPMPQGEGRC